MTNQKFRLDRGGLIDRNRPVNFTFNGQRLQGYEGDTLASALVANGVRLVGRSFKYHRPRGLLGAGVEEPNALVQTGRGAETDVNLRATEVLLSDGLEARSVNCWPNVKFDVGAINNLASRFLSAGFYYKTFMWPTWHLYEWAIRRAAGLGSIPNIPDTRRYENHYDHCDVLVVGGGAAGLAAARAAAVEGCRVILAEQDTRLGGRLLWDEAVIDGKSGQQWIDDVQAELAAKPEVLVLSQTTVLGYFDHNALTLLQQCPANGSGPRQRLRQVRAKQVILAAGSLERPLVFAGNDRPGVMLASAVRQYLNRYAAKAGSQAIVFTNNDDAYRTAVMLAGQGVDVRAVVDVRTEIAQPLVAELQRLSIPLIEGGSIVGTAGGHSLKRVTIRDGQGKARKIAADLLAMSGGFNPTVHLFSQSGGKLVYDQQIAAIIPAVSVQQEVSVGGAAGDFSLEVALAKAHRAGVECAYKAGFSDPTVAPPSVSSPTGSFAIHACWNVGDGRGKAFVDYQNDVTSDDIALAARENFQSIEHLKRYTTMGMAPDQGKTSNVNGLAIMASLTGQDIQHVGVTRFRFPFTPVSFGALSGSSRGDLLRPIRRMPAHSMHEKHGATFEEYGPWKRPAYYLRPGEAKHDAEQREAMAVRSGVGLFEGSPLGKIEVIGPDAGVFLDRIYANTMSTLKIGKARYGLMLNELGVVMDDGVTLRLGEDHFWVGTTGAAGDRIAAWMEEWLQCEWLDLKVIVAPVTQAWGVLTVTGPKARDVLTAIEGDIPFGPEDFPHMSFRDGHLGGIPVLIARVSYTGEVSYEINMPARRAMELWHKLFEAGAPFGITPVGIDAWTLLRTEKGYIHIGADTDGSTSPDDIGWGHIMKKKSDFVGRRSLTRPADLAPDRLQFVGLRAKGDAVLPIGAHLGSGRNHKSEGYVTSSGYSPSLQRGVALGMVKGGRSRMGEMLNLITGGSHAMVEIVPLCSYDEAGIRLNG
jgi:sarcosine oxidase, subunit alpha